MQNDPIEAQPVHNSLLGRMDRATRRPQVSGALLFVLLYTSPHVTNAFVLGCGATAAAVFAYRLVDGLRRGHRDKY